MNVMLDKLKNRFPNINLTSRHISNILRDNNISLKLTRIRHEPEFRYGKPIIWNPMAHICVINN